jgi:hypothetical protein
MDNLIKVLEDNYKIILEDYDNFKFEDKYGINSGEDFDFSKWKNEYDQAFKRVQKQPNDIIAIQKFDHWYAYKCENLLSWESILIGYKQYNYICPNEYGKRFFSNSIELFKNFNQIDKIVVAKLVSGGKIPLHKGDSKFHRIHLGLIVPKGDIAFQVNGDVIKWQKGKAFFFNDEDPHMAWNNTNYDRIILIVDVVK